MKIGEFSVHGGISKDTIRYYVEEGLLIPDVKGGYMTFSQRDLSDLEYIQKYKRAGFSIREINLIMAIRRTSNLTESAVVQDYYDILERKKKSIHEQIDSLNDSLQLIEDSVQKLNERIHLNQKKLGVPLQALSLLACPHCGGSLSLEQAQLSSKYVYEGVLKCDCGYHVKIHDGVVITEKHYIGQYDHPDLSYGGYYDNVSKNFVTYLQKSFNYVYARLKDEDLRNKVVLETNLDGYVFLYRHFVHLKNDCTYILIDKFEETIYLLKQCIERLGMDFNILFIADASVDYPLRPACVDYFIDFYGEDEFLLYHQQTFVEAARKFFSPVVRVLGAYMSYDDHSRSLQRVQTCYPEASPQAFSRHVVADAYQREGFSFESTEIGVMTETYEKYRYQCHITGENLHMNCFTAHRAE